MAHLQSRGLFGARDFDKVIFTLPIPRFSAKVALHRTLAKLGREAETKAAATPIADDAAFQRARRTVREALRTDGVADRIGAAVNRLIDGG